MNYVAEYESKGFQFSLKGEEVIVRAPERDLSPRVLMRLRRHAEEIREELKLQVFIRLVIAYGVGHGILLDEPRIRIEIDSADRAALMTASLAERQAWAQLLAYRLSHLRINR